ncbi:dmX-like protein 2 isoform X3 [Amphibalanus amphitrite]|uniref:dmX-like protein 2 isoform X3 n=1 Tax=Amphibalanus amphitrite TaxID=1232801 RepID=UPI001C91CB05|nr:dmX-like protein 2 isoform X3 [Amphibalanus amphitrite]
MRCHQILTGACNASTDCFAVGTVFGVPFTVYATGCDLVIMDQNFDRVQIIPGVNYDQVQISCVDCSADCGKIAAAYSNRVCIFAPVPYRAGFGHGGCIPTSLLQARWELQDTIRANCAIHNLSWNLEGTHLLTGGDFLQMWIKKAKQEDPGDARRVKFAVGEDAEDTSDHVWECLWRVRTAEPVHYMAFSRDGTLFATAGLGDQIVKVWYEKKQAHLSHRSASSWADWEAVTYDFIYLAHPLPVTGLQWRHTSRFMHRGAVANMLVTSCRDNICRVWVETTRVPDDGMVDTGWLSATSHDNMHLPRKHKQHKVLQKFKHMRQCFHLRRPRASQQPDWRLLEAMAAEEAAGQPRTALQTLHFHLAASISAESDIPLVPSMGTSETGSSLNFMVHWLNNKEMTYTDAMERLAAEMDRLEQQQHEAADRDHSPSGDGSDDGVTQSSPNLSAVSSSNTLEAVAAGCVGSDELEGRLAALLRDWEQGSDLLFSIHPVDGSFLVWTIDYLDEHHPSFRQAQVSFSSRIPQAFPLGDAMTMSTKLCLFAPTIIQPEAGEAPACPVPLPPAPFPSMAMVSKHDNGSLNLWCITFSEESKFKTVLNVAHERRVCGHRFRVNDITCHPVLPLMLSTSHHNPQPRAGQATERPASQTYTSELILWRVDPIGPLSRTSGGVTELTRVNVPEMSAFSHVAWVPTLLPSTTLGPICNSPSTCFVASDGRNLNLYQAVIDARSLLAEINNAKRKMKRMGSGMSDSSDNSSIPAQLKQTGLSDAFRLVSQQSASRPGCVIHLNTIPDVTHDWEHTQFLHVYQEQLIVGRASGAPTSRSSGWYPADPSFSAIVDLHQTESFSEPFYIVVIERDTLGTMIHMWRVVLSSQPLQGENGQTDSPGDHPSPVLKPVSISTVKVCTQRLPLPEGVEVTCATPAAGHLSSASIYPACFATYHVVTACSDNTVRFWKCRVSESGGSADGAASKTYQWCEWEMTNSTSRSSALKLPGVPLTVSVAYSARVSCAYKIGRSFTRKEQERGARFINLGVVIYECESSGGSEWVKEDTIMLHNVPLPRLYTPGDADTSLLEAGGHRYVLSGVGTQPGGEGDEDKALGMRTAPSFINDNTVKSAIAEEGNILMSVAHKHLVRIDWVSSEDGSHMLTLGVGSKILMFSRVSSDITVANMKAMKENQQTARPILQKASSIALSSFTPDQIRWMKIRQVKLESADGLPPIPMQMSWVRDGVLIVGMDNEMHVYSQWKMPPLSLSRRSTTDLQPLTDDFVASRNLTDQQLFTYASDSMKKRIMSVSSLANMDLLKGRAAESARGATQDYMPNYGLFVASRIAFPVLPQYHPKQLMELLNCGKVKRVKAILAHIVRYVRSLSRQSRLESSTADPDLDDPDIVEKLARSRGMSVSLQPGSPLERQQTEDIRPDYEEIDSVPPLPLWMLLAADRDRGLSAPAALEEESYDDLFKVDDGEATLEDIIGANKKRRKSTAGPPEGLSFFGPRESRMLTQLLTHCHLPDLTSIDQLYLIALADTVASVDADLADCFDESSDDAAEAQKSQGPTLDSVDDSGLRFVLAMRNFTYLSKCLPPKEKAELNSQGLTSSYVVWGFHSESQEELVQLVPCVARAQPQWRELQQLGAGWWIRSNTLLKRIVEQIAKTAYQKTKDPMDAALYYFAMRKRTVIAALYKQMRDDRRYKFFSKDFTTPDGRTAAKKNAYQCLGKQKFESAAALFLLADSLPDCVEVILTKLHDLQLAMLVCRLYDGELDSCPPSLQQLLNKEILGVAEDGTVDLAVAHPDPFLRSMAYWIKKDYSASLNTLLKVNVGTLHTAYQEEDAQTYYGTSPTVFNFYVYLRTHPLIVKQYKAQGAQDRRRGRGQDAGDEDKQFFHVDAITPLERQLYFSTAHAHYRAGCPTLALEVLSKLPSKVLDSCPEAESAVASPVKSAPQDKRIDTGIIDWSQPEPLSEPEPVESLLAPGGDTAAALMDAPRVPSPLPQSLGQDFDWSTPVRSRLAPEPLELNWDDDRGSDTSTDTGAETQTQMTSGPGPAEAARSGVLDIMAQQLKFIGCLQLMMEELSNLASGLGVDGGQLRYQLYLWLERQVDALIDVCNYDGGTVDVAALPTTADEEDATPPPCFPGDRRPTLHDVLLTDKMDFEAKLQRATRRKTWLKANQALLRTLLSYCSLQGAAGGALASVRMELILLLQELQQESSRQQLLSPLPFPTMIPLLSASVANNKTVVMDPVRHLQAIAHDLLQVVAHQTAPPSPNVVEESALAVLKNTAVALSSCVYQALCDSDAFKVKQKDGLVGYSVDGIVAVSASHLTAGLGARCRRASADQPPAVTSPPAKWPGVTSLRALLSREKDDDGPQLTVLLAEVFAAVYTSLLITAIACSDARLLYRLVRLKVDTRLWSAVFGGGARKLLRVATNVVTPSTPAPSELASSPGDTSLLSSLNKQRAKLNMKLLGQLAPGSGPTTPGLTPPTRDEHPTYREVFVPPEASIVQLILAKPPPDPAGETEESTFDYDSDTESLADDQSDRYGEEDDGLTEVNTEHSDPNSYSWKLMRFACMKLCKQKITQILSVAGIEQQELPVASPLVHTILRLMDRWSDELEAEVNSSRQPAEYIPNLNVDESARGPPIVKYRAMLQPFNTPFDQDAPGVGAVKRLWLVLARHEAVQDTFIRVLFSRRAALGPSIGSGADSDHEVTTDPIKIIHKEQDAITAFCINQANPNMMVMATQKELQELDVALLVSGPTWLESETDYDSLNPNRDPDSMPSSNYLVVQLPSEAGSAGLPGPGPGGSGYSGPGSAASSLVPSPTYSQTGRAPAMMLRHKVEGVRRLCAHPTMSVYITGAHDGSVTVREWGAENPVAVPRPSGTYAKVNRVRFNTQGNKFGVADNDGNLSLWQMTPSAHNGRPFYAMECHSKVCSDFVFVGSSSLLATAGLSADNKNVCLWDTLLPKRKAQVAGFCCHESGASALLYSSQHQLLISGGKRGNVCIFDVRRRQVRHRFSAHEAAIKCMALDPAEEYFVTGSDEGDIKVWGLTVRDAFFSFPAEHARGGFFKNAGHGVTQLHIDDEHRLYSCGADGSMKLRAVPHHRDTVVQSVY